MTVDLAKLIERLEAATGPDRELDLEIDLYAWPASDIADIAKKHPRGLGSEGYAWDIWHGAVVVEKRTADGRCPYNAGYPLPAYTSSIDAAMTLVPDAKRPNGAAQIAFPRLLRFSENQWDVNIGYGNSAVGVNASAPTPALALCIAALKARSLNSPGGA